MLCPSSKTYCWYDDLSKTFKFSSKTLNERVLEHKRDCPLDKNHPVLDEVNNTPTNRGFCTKNYTVATYEQVKKGLSYYNPKTFVESDGLRTQPPNL